MIIPLNVPLPDAYVCDDYIPRCSEDKVINTKGHLLIDFCKETSLIMLNDTCGYNCNPEKYTFV